MKPNEKQVYKCFYLINLLSNTSCNIEIFRYDRKYQTVYILAVNARGEEIEILVDRDGELKPL